MSNLAVANKPKLEITTNHDHFWIEAGRLYESYNTIRGLRFMFKLNVPDMPDCLNCTAAMITYIEKEYLYNI